VFYKSCFLWQINDDNDHEYVFSSQARVIFQLTYLQNYTGDSSQSLHGDKDLQLQVQ